MGFFFAEGKMGLHKGWLDEKPAEFPLSDSLQVQFVEGVEVLARAPGEEGARTCMDHTAQAAPFMYEAAQRGKWESAGFYKRLLDICDQAAVPVGPPAQLIVLDGDQASKAEAE